MSSKPRFPQVRLEVDCSAREGNIYAIMGAISAQLPRDAGDRFWEECSQSRGYEQALDCCQRWVNITFINDPRPRVQ
jgi:hypothetical protein